MQRHDQRSLVNFAVGDPLQKKTYGEFKEAFRALHGKLPQGKDILPYLESHPDELRRLRGESPADQKSRSRKGRR